LYEDLLVVGEACDHRTEGAVNRDARQYVMLEFWLERYLGSYRLRVDIYRHMSTSGSIHTQDVWYTV
jgi:hypothetical protein